MYTTMKYWGKKPHNIWGQFIERYCPVGGVVLDPFAGSAVAAFEAIKIGRKSLAFDLNPLTSFIIEVFTTEFNRPRFLQAFSEIEGQVKNDPVYVENYVKEWEGEKAVVYNYRWSSNEVVSLAIETLNQGVTTKGKPMRGRRIFAKADDLDNNKAVAMKNLAIPYLYPTDKFPDTPTIKHKFINDVGGNGFEFLWTRRNLYVLARIFHEINKQQDKALKLHLLLGFIQTVHLSSKMVVPRHETAKRDFSGSWGRADYMIRRRQMEQNPLIIFHRSCLDKQGVISGLEDAKSSLPHHIKIDDLNKIRKIRPSTDITYGILDIADLSEYVEEKSVDLVITDPPYAGLIPYLDLSLVWLVWLQKVDSKYLPDLKSEITIKKGIIDRAEYRRRLQNGFKQLHRVLKDDGYCVITFHHKKMQEWNDFVRAVRLAGFKFDKVTHQYNRRSGESNVANPYGTSGADFYIRCVKHRGVDFSDDISGLKHFIIEKTKEIISLRNEPTPYEFIVAGIIPEMLQAGYQEPKEYREEINRVLLQNIGEGNIFRTWKNEDDKAGDYWWFRQPQNIINFPDRPLADRLEETIISILRRKVSVKLDDILSELFQSYSNGLTPDPRNITKILEKYAYRAAGKWKIKSLTISDNTEHSEIISQVAHIGKGAGFAVFVGKREQSEVSPNGMLLRNMADFQTLERLRAYYDSRQIERIEMIDTLWLSKRTDRVECVFEVENSTNFISAIVRGSNLEKGIPKFMVVPRYRETELSNISDPLFLTSFRDSNWCYTTYEDIHRLYGYSKPSVYEMMKISKCL